jgi:L-fuconolactonase
MIIDTHHHFWHYNPVDYDWIDEEMQTIRRSFLPEDLIATIQATEVEGVISVQARQSIEETDWLLELAEQHELIKGVIGWLPLKDVEIEEILEKYASNKWLKGVRHVVQGEPDPEFILGKAFNDGIKKLKNHQLIYEILIFEHQLPNTSKFVDQHPNQLFVLDHIAKPRIRKNELEPWAKNLKVLAKRENVYCKLSGMVTEADYNVWTIEQLQPYFDTVLEAFGPERLMFGSDWPVCLVAVSYKEWVEIVLEQITSLSNREQEMIKSLNAIDIYNI